MTSWARYVILLTASTSLAAPNSLFDELAGGFAIARQTGDSAAVSNQLRRVRAASKDISGGNYALLLFDAALSFRRANSPGSDSLKLAYELEREARQTLLSASVNEQLSQLPRHSFTAAQYSTTYDSRPFSTARMEEAEIVLKAWQNAELQRERYAGVEWNRMPAVPPSGLSKAEVTLWEQKAREAEDRVSFDRLLASYSYSSPRTLRVSYAVGPQDYGELRGLLNYYLSPDTAQRAWDAVTNGLPRRPVDLQSMAAAAVPKVIVPTRDHPSPSSQGRSNPDRSLPAIAWPNANRPAQPAATHSAPPPADPPGAGKVSMVPHGEEVRAEPSSKRSLWPWVAIGLAALAAFWLKMRR